MTDRPIPFTETMVRALLDGGKTQTRRALKQQPPAEPKAHCSERHTPRHVAPYLDAYCSERKTASNPRGMSTDWCWWQVDDRQCLPTFKVPYAPGDRLWVKEAWRAEERFDDRKPSEIPPGEAIEYLADWPRVLAGRTRHGMFIMRWMSRLTLIVESVRVERLNEIREEDARAEGCFVGKASGRIFENVASMRLGGAEWANARNWYADLWESLHGAGAWDANPWVAVIGFRVILDNIDAIGGADRG